MKDATALPAWSNQTLELIKAAKALNVQGDGARKIIDAFVTIDMAIKITQQVERLLQEAKSGTLDVNDFLDAILNILRTDKPLMGTKVEVLHAHMGVPMIQKAPRPKKAKPAAQTPAA